MKTKEEIKERLQEVKNSKKLADEIHNIKMGVVAASWWECLNWVLGD